MSDEEVADRGDGGQDARQARVRATRARCESIKQAMRHGIDIIYHASFTDEEALDMLEARKDRIFVAPGIGDPDSPC